VDAKTLTYLEFEKIMDRLAVFCVTPAGHAAAAGLVPTSDLDEAIRRQTLTAEAKLLRRLKANFFLSSVEPIEDEVRTASRAGQLSPQDVLRVAGFLRSARYARNHIVPLARDLPILAAIAGTMGIFGGVIETIDAALDERGQIRDNASPDLPGLRRNTRIAHDRLLRQVEGVLRRAVADGIAQDSIVTERDGRYVIPLKSEARSQLPSVVHDTSSSGATVFVEPLATVELGNKWREARLAEEREIERILRSLSQAIGAQAGEILASVTALGEIDFNLAKASFGSELQAVLPVPGEPVDWLVEAPAEFRIQTGRHPLLRGEVVPITLTVGGESPGVLVTGPNTGGKTVALKTVGLLALMALAGIPVPAEQGTQIPVFQSIWADIGDEQSIEQSLSTFSAHMTNIIRILEAADAQSLVLLDELGAGTDPTEGAALGRAILTRLLRLGTNVVATTHHSELKVFAHDELELTNASVEFDPETLAPTYRLMMGLPGRSNAIAIARRLGMPEDVLEEATAHISPDQATVENLLGDLQTERSAAEDSRRAEEFARQEAEEIREGLRKRRDEIELEREALIARTEAEMERELADLRRAIRTAEKELAKQRKVSLQQPAMPATSVQGAITQADEASEGLGRVRRERISQQRRRSRRQGQARPDPTSIRIGDAIYLEGVDQPGEALSEVGSDGHLEVQLGALRTRVNSDQIIKRSAPGRRQTEPAVVPGPPPDPGSRIEVRGQTLDEALPTVEEFIDRAYRAGNQRLEVVHGKGTGTLRQAVRQMLGSHPLVSRFEGADRRDGGEGVTIVVLAT
jgi:DNA mismatch repair protein MutS2